MSGYVIDGLFLTQQITGIQRYAYEITRELDLLMEEDELEIVVPLSADNLPAFQNIKIVYYGRRKGILWQQTDLAHYLKKKKKRGIFFTNTFPLVRPDGMIVIHDVSYKANPHFFTSKRDRLSALWHRLNYWRAAHSKAEIVTVSNFSKAEIMKYYHINSERITVIYNAWQHMERIPFATDTFEKYPMLTKGNYYFSMSTLAANKNFRWILEAARNNPDEIFAIAGGGRLQGVAAAEGYATLTNIHFLGYVSDEDAKTLMKNCKAFLFPTLYEGFGIPPLEAIACGAQQVIVSDTPCMHEIYENCVNYTDPNNISKEMSNFYNRSNIKVILRKYSWKKSAEQMKKKIRM